MDLKVYILCRFAHNSSLYTSWLDQCPLPYRIVDDFAPEWQVPDDAGLIVTHLHYRWEEIHALRQIYDARQIPILVLADGILEYRNTWEHPDLADGSIFQPLVGNKIACIGRGQARILESWGNTGKAEVVGIPRLDSVLYTQKTPVHRKGTFRLLVATAKTPAFDDAQRATVVESLSHIKQRLDKNQIVNGRPVQVTWRLTDGLIQEIGLADASRDEYEERPLPPLSEVIDQSDAVVTTPSTLYLESALKKRPTAVLDFHNCPHYVPAAWVINAPKHLNWTLAELENPPAAKMLFQDTVLHDQLECFTPATPRLIQLIEAMVDARRVSLKRGHPLQLAARILSDNERGFARVEEGFDLTKLYPENRVFQQHDVTLLQAELAQALQRLGKLPRELADKNRYITTLLQQRDSLALRVSDLRMRIRKLRRLVGIENPSDRD